MKSDWATYTIADVAQRVITGKTPPGTLDEYFGGETLFVTPTDMEDDKHITETIRTLSVSGKEKLNKQLFTKGIVVSCIGWQMGKSAIVKQPSVTNQQVNTVVPDENVIDLDFLYYVLKSKRDEIFNLGATATRTPILKKSLFEKISFDAPCLIEQKKIGKLLSQFDDKIQLNTQTNQTLEQMAQAIFKSWFVDFDPVKAKMKGEQPEGMDATTASLFPEKLVESELGLIPDGWRVDSLGNYLDVLETGKRPKGGVKGITEGIPSVGAENILGVGNYQYGKEKFIPEDLFVSLKKGVVESEDVLIYKDGGKPGDFKPRFSMFGYGFPYKTFAINEHVFRIRSSKLGQPYLYCQMRDDYVYNDLRNKGAKAAIPGINQKDVKSMLIVVPNELLLSKFNDSVASIFEMILKNALQSQELAKLRDTLLPKLLSGEIELAEKAES